MLLVLLILIGFESVFAFECTGKSAGYHCDESDCATRYVCGLSSKPLSTTLCSNLDASKPYCENGICVETLPIACAFDCTEKLGYHCGDDCLTIYACVNSPVPLQAILCSNLDPSKPYCDNINCVETPPSSCGIQVQNITVTPTPAYCTTGSTIADSIPNPFYCTSEGTFPDPNDCTKYHYCSGAGAIATTTSCGTTETYISSINMCSSTSECQTIDCSTSALQNKFILNEHDPRYYAYCHGNPDGSIDTIMFKCPDDNDYVFDATVSGCIYKCSTKRSYKIVHKK